MLAEMLGQTPEMCSLGEREARVVGAFRMWVTSRKRGRCAGTETAQRLGSPRAAAHLRLLIEEVGAAWPEPFCVAPPCCPRLSHDEALLAQMVAAAGAADRPGFDRLLSDLLPADERERLFLSGLVLTRALAAADGGAKPIRD